MTTMRRTVLGLAIAAAVVAATTRRGTTAQANVQLCDGETVLELDTLPDTPEGGMQVAAALMAEWQKKNPGPAWAMGSPQDPETREKLLRQRYQPKAPFDNRGLVG